MIFFKNYTPDVMAHPYEGTTATINVLETMTCKYCAWTAN